MFHAVLYQLVQVLYEMYRWLPIPRRAKTCLITGANRGIGRALALQLASEGVNVVLAGRQMAPLQLVKQEIEAKYRVNVMCQVYDVTDYECTGMLHQLHAEMGPIDCVVLNAGIGHSVVTGAKNSFQKELSTIQTNVLGPMALVNAFVLYAKQYHIQDPHVVAVTSVAADIPRPKKGAYGASKAALGAYLNAASLELGQEGFWFTNIKPGFIDTDMTSYFDSSIKVSSGYAAKEMSFAMQFRFKSWYTPLPYYPLSVLYQWMPQPLIQMLNK